MVLYLVCFDLSAPINEQRKQIHTWLHYLHSLLSRETYEAVDLTTAKWRVLIVGTKADLQQEEGFTTTESWQKSFPEMPIFGDIISISTLVNDEKATHLHHIIQQECMKIMDNHSKLVPTAYRLVLQDIKEINAVNNIIQESDIPKHNHSWKSDLLSNALAYLHAIGQIVYFTGGRICTNPEVVPRIMAKINSPLEIRNKLLWDEDNQLTLLTKTDIDAVIGLNSIGNTR